jgi:hypothetical protein
VQFKDYKTHRAEDKKLQQGWIVVCGIFGARSQ